MILFDIFCLTYLCMFRPSTRRRGLQNIEYKQNMAEAEEAMEVSEIDAFSQKKDTVSVTEVSQSLPDVQSEESTVPVPENIDNHEKITISIKTPQDKKVVTVSANAGIKEVIDVFQPSNVKNNNPRESRCCVDSGHFET